MQKLTRQQAAEYLGVSVATLNRWASIGDPYIPFRKSKGALGKAFYDQEDLDAYLCSTVQIPTRKASPKSATKASVLRELGLD